MEANSAELKDSIAALSARMAEAVEGVSPAVVALDARPRVRTSGVIWRPGVVVSTDHTVRRDEEITVTLHDGREVKATLAGRDAGTDLAVLRLEEDADAGVAAGGPPRFTDASALRVGHLVLAVGRAYPEHGVGASFGIVGLLGGRWRTWRGGEIDHLVRPAVNIFIGFSGGALIDTEGRIVGVNTTALARGTGLTVPASTVERVADQLLARGRVARPYLGVGRYLVALPEKLREKSGLPQAVGLMMLSVEPGGPADEAGIIVGDILLALGETPVADSHDVREMLSGRAVGDTLEAKILRGGEVKEVELTLGERPTRRR